MKDLKMIACISEDRGIGYQGELLWHLQRDIKFFKIVTDYACVVMGRKTFESIGHTLPGRRNIVLSETEPDDKFVQWAKDMQTLRSMIKDVMRHGREVFIIGGASLYNEFIDEVDTLYLTEVKASRPADTFFPDFDRTKFDKNTILNDVQGTTEFTISIYRRLK